MSYPFNVGNGTAARRYVKYLDFWLMGGLGLAAWAILALLQVSGLIARHPGISLKLDEGIGLFVTLGLLINNPHALWSYKLAYGQGPALIKRHPWELVVLPLWMILAVLSGLYFARLPMSSCPALLRAEQWLDGYGLFLHASMYPNLGAFILSLTFAFQIFFLGQHYVMQAYGVTLFCAGRDGYVMSAEQRRILRQSLNAVWMVVATDNFTGFSIDSSGGFLFAIPRLPAPLHYVALTFFAGYMAAVASLIVWPMWKEKGRLPPLPAAAAFLSIVVWMQPFLPLHPIYALALVPFGHCLQYLAICAQVETQPKPSGSMATAWLKTGALILVLAAIGDALYFKIPEWLDQYQLGLALTANFCVVTVSLMINVHHYFIDSVVWRSEASEIRGRLRPRRWQHV